METTHLIKQELENLMLAKEKGTQCLEEASLAAIKRLLGSHYHNIPSQTCKEFSALENDYKMTNMNDYKWQVIIDGPVDTPYYDGSFLFEIDFANSEDKESICYSESCYPKKAPKIRCLTKMFHLNIENNGNAKMNVFGDKSDNDQSLNTRDILKSIEKLFIQPDLSENGKYIAREQKISHTLFKTNKNEYNTGC